MALIHHKILKDGSIVHDDFSRDGWDKALHDSDISRHWGHSPDDCHDPVARHWATLRRGGYLCGPKQHELADIEDPGWVGCRKIELVNTPKVIVPPPEPIVWPPDSALTPRVLSEFAGLCVEDCKEILLPPRMLKKSSNDTPKVDKKGQLLLF